MNAKKKIQLVLDEEAQGTLQALQDSTGASSMAEVLRDALGVYNSLRQLLAGPGHQQLALVDRDANSLQELFIPSLLRSTAIVPGTPSSMSGATRTLPATAPAAEPADARQLRLADS